jgi:alanine dehydrogenase
MRYIGIPKETKIGEKRVALTPQGVQKILDTIPDVEVFITKDAGVGAGYSDQEYVIAGARITQSNKETYILGKDLIVKVKEPTENDVNLVCDDSNVLSYIHAAALGSVVAPKVQNLIRDRNVKFYGLELLEKKLMNRIIYPGLIPMSKLAGEIAVEYALKIYSTDSL